MPEMPPPFQLLFAVGDFANAACHYRFDGSAKLLAADEAAAYAATYRHRRFRGSRYALRQR